MTQTTRFLLPYFILLSLPILVCAQTNSSASTNKINGVSFVGPSKAIGIESIKPVQRIGANWIAVIPFGFGKPSTAELQYNTDWQWWGEKTAGAAECIKMSRALGLKVMLKPQVWMRQGAYTGHLAFTKEDDWRKWEADYERFILAFAQIAQNEHADLFCIGTEWEQFVQKRPEFWHQLIGKVRNIYNGPITYAANWDEYTRVPFWSQLDYIGVDAYFPISDQKTPSINNLLRGWQPTYRALKKTAESFDKEILFTEWGYRSVDYCAKTPWDSEKRPPVNQLAQSAATEALLQTFNHEPWFAGGFIWKWYDYDQKIDPLTNKGFTPQNKEVEKVLLKYFKG